MSVYVIHKDMNQKFKSMMNVKMNKAINNTRIQGGAPNKATSTIPSKDYIIMC